MYQYFLSILKQKLRRKMKKKWISLLLSTTMAMGMIMGTGVIALADAEPEEITWMFWDDVKASQDLGQPRVRGHYRPFLMKRMMDSIM